VNISKNSWSEYLYLKDRKLIIIFVGMALAVSSYLGYITPILTRELYLSFEGEGLFEPIIKKLVLLFFAEYIVQVCYQTSINKYVQHLVQHVRSLSYSNWIRSHESLGSGKHGDEKYPMGEVLSRILNDTEAVIELVQSGSFKIFIDLAFIGSCLISFLSLNTTSGIALIVSEVLACFLLLLGSKKMSVVYMAVRKSMGDMSRSLTNITAGLRFSFHTPNDNYASKTSEASFEDFLKKQLKANIWDAGYFALAESLFPILLAVLVLIFPYSQIVEMAVLAAIIDLIQRSINPIKELSAKMSSIQRAKTGIIRIHEFNEDISKLPQMEFDDEFEKINFGKVKVDIENFTYPNQNTGSDKAFGLKDIHFEASQGELIGIVGLSGSGKSTLLKILAADLLSDESTLTIYDVNKTHLTFSAKNIDSIDYYKRQVSIVSQDSHVFSESLKFNITLGQREEHFDEFWKKIQSSVAYLKQWGVTPDSVIDPKDLSMGQKQLLSALRSCFLTKPIVLFDEISSGLDSELEFALRKLVLLIQEHSLTIIVAHRIETIVKSDKILVMHEGCLQNIGTHEKLIQSSAVYQEFIDQLKTLS